MNYKTHEDLQKAINDEKYFKDVNNFCLGKTLEEAGEILAKIVETKEGVKLHELAK